MIQTNPTVAQQITQAAIAFEQKRTGHTPMSGTVVLSGSTLLITLHRALTPAEMDRARNPDGAAQVQELHRQLFASSADALRQEIKRITGAEVHEAAAEVESRSGTIVQAFTTGTVVQVFLLTRDVPTETWSGTGQEK